MIFFLSVEINLNFNISFTLNYSQIYDDKINANIESIRMFFILTFTKIS